ncbi:MAG: hypothetical protein CFE43_09195 [Burkholderiales bacterium PBB3]|nr:MAG: hypothetical protein CFE43_09195 [Burkholderiales bacterium PBB3]
MGPTKSVDAACVPCGVAAQLWSLCWQAAVGRDFLANPSLVRRIRGRLLDAHRRSGRVLIDFVLLPTEIHAVSLLLGDDSVGAVARSFGNVVSRWVREAQPVRSPVLAGPFRAHALSDEGQLLQELRMLAWRAVFLGSCKTPSHHPHGGFRVALGLTPSTGFDARPMLQHFGDSVPTSRKALRQWVARRPTDMERCAWELTRGLVLATGHVGPRAEMARSVQGAAASLVAAAGGYGVDGALELLSLWVSAKLDASCPPDLHSGSGNLAARGRALVAGLARAHRLCSAAAVARHFHRAKATLSEQMAACRLRASDRSILATPLRRILDETALLKASADTHLHRADAKPHGRAAPGSPGHGK